MHRATTSHCYAHMTDTVQSDTDHGTIEQRSDDDRPTELSVTDPEALADRNGLEIRQRTFTHESREHCEADAAGRAIVGVTDEDGRLLVQVNREIDCAVLPNDTVGLDEDWATVGRHSVEERAGISVTLDSVERVRRVEHVVEGESTSQLTTHHVVFGASVASPETSLDGLCEDNDWEIGWYDELPVEVDDDGTGVIDDIRLFLGEIASDRTTAEDHTT